jgi:hypothetical protein
MVAESKKPAFELASRFLLTKLGVERCSKCTSPVGVVVGFSRANVRVLFDGTKTARSLHCSYVEPIAIEFHDPPQLSLH